MACPDATPPEPGVVLAGAVLAGAELDVLAGEVGVVGLVEEVVGAVFDVDVVLVADLGVVCEAVV